MRIVRRGFDADRFQDAQRLHHRRAAGGVVGGAGRVGMRIEVRAEQHDLRREIGAGQLARSC